MNVEEISKSVLFVFALYFASINCFAVVLCLISFRSLSLFSPMRMARKLPHHFSEFMPSVSLIVPAHNEEQTITATLRSLLQLEYPSFEIVCVNDGSSDSTLRILKEVFQLEETVQAPRCTLGSKKISAVYVSKKYANLRVVDKENGGKADALNAGISFSNFEHVSCIDADTILQRDSLSEIVRPFLDDPMTVAVGGTVRIANGCEVRDGHIITKGLPSSLLVKIQTLEYLRAFLFGAVGWAKLNALLNISGAFGLFKRQALIDVGGYHTDTVAEDMDLILRIHAYYRLRKLPYRVHFLADPICWTQAPEDLVTLKNQRLRWHRGLAESLFRGKSMFLNPRAGFIGAFAIPYYILFELLQPIAEILGIILIVVGLSLGWMRLDYVLALSALAFCSSLFLSTVCILLEEAFFHVQTRIRDILWLFTCAIIENFGYRQMISWFQLIGIGKWLVTTSGEWGSVRRRKQ
jgi:cellulose synthase/poly-beta-1,6-N-acetylglucosamine synthase-like glycosyltransferase